MMVMNITDDHPALVSDGSSSELSSDFEDSDDNDEDLMMRPQIKLLNEEQSYSFMMTTLIDRTCH